MFMESSCRVPIDPGAERRRLPHQRQEMRNGEMPGGMEVRPMSPSLVAHRLELTNQFTSPCHPVRVGNQFIHEVRRIKPGETGIAPGELERQTAPQAPRLSHVEPST